MPAEFEQTGAECVSRLRRSHDAYTGSNLEVLSDKIDVVFQTGLAPVPPGAGGRGRLMPGSVLITGGAGFIASHCADNLLRRGYRVRALDNLSPQVHGERDGAPDYLDPEVELVVGDVRDPACVRRALDDVDAVFHFAARVGVGQSMY